MKTARGRISGPALVLFFLFGAATLSPAWATLVFIGPEDFQGTGLGAVNTILTIGAEGPGSDSEQGCVGRSVCGTAVRPPGLDSGSSHAAGL